MSYKRSGRVKLLFWLSFLTIFLYLWILSIIFQTFILPTTPPMELPTDRVTMILILYSIMALTTLSGTIISILINNRRYIRIFGVFIIVIFASIIIGKSILG